MGENILETKPWTGLCRSDFEIGHPCGKNQKNLILIDLFWLKIG
jgi:hypothetical protein